MVRRAQPVFETVYQTGMRCGEALGLTWDKVNRETLIITLFVNVSDGDLPAAIDMMKFDKGETEIKTKK